MVINHNRRTFIAWFLTLVCGFCLGVMFWLPFLFTDKEVFANVTAFFGGIFR